MKKIFILIIASTIYKIGHSQMVAMDLTERIINSTIRIEARRNTTINGVKEEIISTGTGFFFEFSNAGKTLIAIVSNAHVVNLSQRGVLQFTVAKSDGYPDYGNNISIQISNFESKWIKHPNQDLAVLPLSDILDYKGLILGKKPSLTYFNENDIPNENYLKQVNFIEEVLMVGYPKGLFDMKNNIPIVRQGTTATPISLDYEGMPKFLLNVPIYPGSSGSPIYLYNLSLKINRNGQAIMAGGNCFLAGITVESYVFPNSGEVISKDTVKSETVTELPIDIAIVIKSSQLLAFKPLLTHYFK